MGCLSRIGCLVVLAGAGGVGYWLYGDRLPSEIARAASTAASKVREAAGGPSAATSVTPSARSNDSSARSDRAIAWANVANPGASRPNVAASLAKRDGPAFVSLGAVDLAALLSSTLPGQLPKSASSLQVALVDHQVLVRAVLDATEIAGDGTLGRVLGVAMTGRDSVRLAGTIEPLRSGVAQFRVQELRVKGLNVPARLIPAFVGALRRGARVDGLADDALVVTLPRTVADLRIAKGRLILYKAIPNP